MPRDPNEAFQVSVDVDDEKRWRLRLSTVVEVDSPHKDRRKDAVFLSWHFTVHDLETGAAVTDNNSGLMYELWHASNDSTFYDPKTVPPKIGGAREIAHVLMGRDLNDDEVRAMNADGIQGWADALSGKTMLADLEWAVDKKGYNRLNILRMRVDTQAKTSGAATSPPPTNGTTAETPEERRARLLAELESIPR